MLTLRIPTFPPISPYVRPQSIREQVNFIKVELLIGRSYCHLAQKSDLAHLPRYLKNARRAYENVMRFLMRVHLEGQEFNEITANTEGLKFALAALEKRLHT